MMQLIDSAGPLVWPLLLCSVLALAIILEKSWSLRESSVLPHQVYNAWLNSSRTGIPPITSAHSQSTLGILLAKLTEFKQKELTQHQIENEAEYLGKALVHNLEYRLNLLGIIATITPLLGLLGTVLGMIEIFSQLMQSGIGQPEQLAGGISEALLTTALGLGIAIPCLMAYHIFQKKVERYANQLEHYCHQFLHQSHHDLVNAL